MKNLDKLRELYKKYELTDDDYFKHNHYTIITRSGIDKIQAKADIKITYELIYHTPDLKTAVIKCYANIAKVSSIETYGEVSPNNNKNAYPIAMAEKRAMSRAVLKLAGFYAHGAFGEDEADDFKRPKIQHAKPILTETHKDYEGVVAQLKDGSLTIDDVIKHYEVGHTLRYNLENISRG